MKSLILTFILSIAACAAWAHEGITEDNYMRADSLLWTDYNSGMLELLELKQQKPEASDSIDREMQNLYTATSAQNIELAKKYAATPSGMQRMYMCRANIPKDTLSQKLAFVPAELRDSYYGRLVKQHIETRQLREGDMFETFSCTGSDGKSYDWSMAEGKYILIVYSGLSCMGDSGREGLERLHSEFCPGRLEIVVYQNASDPENLRAIDEAYSMHSPSVSDFLNEASPVRILYGAQATPTCIFVSPSRRIVNIYTGFSYDRYAPLITGQ